jgi:serine kinase of HPr protein (carbohydrate metabolism regulator)
MQVNELIEKHAFKKLSGEALDREIKNVYSCDLLSWVMAKGKHDTAWITVQTHNNILAVASLLDFACVIIPEGIKVEEDIVAKANEQEIILLSTPLDSYEIFKILYKEGIA